VEYVPVEPAIVVEIDVDTSFEDHRWRHAATFLRLRADLVAADLTA